MPRESSPSPWYRSIAAFVRNYPYLHQGIGLLGNALFVVGTVLFLTSDQDVGRYFFLAGSSGMFVGSLGEILRAEGRKTLKKHDVDPQYPHHRWSERA